MQIHPPNGATGPVLDPASGLVIINNSTVKAAVVSVVDCFYMSFKATVSKGKVKHGSRVTFVTVT